MIVGLIIVASYLLSKFGCFFLSENTAKKRINFTVKETKLFSDNEHD